MVTINTLNGGDITITTTPPIAPSPYFTYDSNRVITGLYQGSPNVLAEGTYTDYNDWQYAEQHDGEYPEKSYSGWTYGGSNVVENYATTIGTDVFNDINEYHGNPPSRGIAGNITFQNVTSIMGYAFMYCNKLTNVTMPNVMSIGNYAFGYCSALTSVTMPNLTSSGAAAFYNCFKLTSVTIGSGIQEIGGGTFNTQGNPITLTIGKTVAEVQDMGQTNYDYDTNTPYSEWGLPSGSTIVCTNGTIPIEEE